jgi:hypothetical protein
MTKTTSKNGNTESPRNQSPKITRDAGARLVAVLKSGGVYCFASALDQSGDDSETGSGDDDRGPTPPEVGHIADDRDTTPQNDPKALRNSHDRWF